MFEMLLHSIVEKLSANVLVLMLAGLTVTSSGLAGAKLYNAYAKPEQATALAIAGTGEALATEADSETGKGETSAGLTASESEHQSLLQPVSPTTPTPMPKTQPSVTPSNPSKQSGGALSFPAAQVMKTTNNSTTAKTTTESSQTTNNAQTATTGCLITVSGNTYNVQSLRSTHPGGDVFVCDTDMTSMFNKAHGSNYSMLQPYLITSGSTSTSGSSTTSSSVGSTITQPKSLWKEQEREDDEYEEESENHYEYERWEDHD